MISSIKPLESLYMISGVLHLSKFLATVYVSTNKVEGSQDFKKHVEYVLSY